MKRSKLSYDEWKCILSKDIRGRNIKAELVNGYIGLIHILEVSDPQIWNFNGENITVCDTGMKWLSILPCDEYFCITAMMNEKEEILLWYIDMIAEQGIGKDGIPYFDDLYLDLVVYPDGTIVEDDMDELEEALKQKDITVEQYKLAIETGKKLKADLLHDISAFIDFTKKCYEIIKE